MTSHIYSHKRPRQILTRLKVPRVLTLFFFTVMCGFGFMQKANAQASKQTTPNKTGFIENKGQIIDQNSKLNPSVKYLLSLPGLNVQLKANSFSYDAYTITRVKQETEGTALPTDIEEYDVTYKFHRIDIEFLGANPNPQIITANAGKDVLNYFTTGTDRNGATGVRHFGKVTYKNLYPGIDLEFTAQPGTKKPVEYNFIVHPGADASKIKWKYKGSNSISLDNSTIKIKTIHGDLSENIPLTFEKENNATIDVVYQNMGDNTFGFSIGDYNHENTLIIDPLPDLKWATYYGGSDVDFTYGVLSDASNNVYVVGASTSAASIATTGTHQNTYGGGSGYGSGGDAFIVKLDASGSRIWATYYGGSGNEQGQSIGIDNSGNLYVEGTTSSTSNIATTGAFQTTRGNTYNDVFLAKFTNNGFLVWGTYFGGGGNDQGTTNGLVVDEDANIYFTGQNNSTGTGITTPGAYMTARTTTPAYDYPFVAKFDSTGSIIWGTYFSGPNHDQSYCINIDANKNVYIGGAARATSGIATTGAHQTSLGGGIDGYIAKFNSTGTALLWSTYFGGSGNDVVRGIDFDANGDVIIGGYTASSSGIATTGTHSNSFNGGNYDGFLAKFTPSGTQVWGTYYGGSDQDVLRALRTDKSGDIIIAGDATSTSGIATTDGFQNSYGGGIRDVFVSKFDNTGKQIWGSYYGGSEEDLAWSCELGASSVIYVVGRTVSPSGIATTGGHQTTYGGGTFDGYIIKFQELEGNNNAGISSFTSPDKYVCAGSQDIKVEIVNAGLDTIKTLSVNWEVNGTPQTPFSISSQLAPGTSRVVTLGSLNFTAGIEQKFKIWTNNPNGVADTVNQNDTIQTSRKPGLSGTYTIGGTSPDYATFNDAVNDLNAYGICGPVEFNIAAGTYTEYIALEAINGTSLTNTITFRGAGTGSTKITYTSTSPADLAVIILNGSDHITFRDMEIENTSMGFGSGIWYTNGADSNKFINLIITLPPTATSGFVNGIVGSGSATGLSDGNTGNYLLFDSIEVNGGYHGIRITGPNTTGTYASNVTISNSTFTNQFQYGLLLRNQANLKVWRNNILPCRNSTSFSMFLENCSQLEVANNNIEANDNGLFLVNANRYAYNSSIPSRIFNNMVSSTSDYALYTNNSKHLKIWHNSFNADASQSVIEFESTDVIDLRNNHIINYSTSVTPYVVYADDPNTFTAIDYNNYNSNGNFIHIGSTNYPNLPILQAAITTQNQNSVNRSPLFTSNTDLHTSINIPGVYVNIDEDIDGDFRSNVSPVVGADEVNVPNNAGISKIISPTPVFCAGAQDVKVQIGNYGVNAIDSVRVYWQVDGVAQSTNYISTQIATRGFLDVSLGSITFASGDSKTIKVWTAFPNGVKDSLANNDTLEITVKTGLTGTYTIGGSNSPDYPDFSSAIFDLNVLGICGPVVFEVAPGTYFERVTLSEVTGASSTNTITFKGAAKATTSLSFTGSNPQDWATLMLDGGDYYIFRDLTVTSTGANYGIAVMLTNEADSNQFINMNVNTSITSTSQDIATVAMIPDPTTLYGGSGSPGSGNIFDSLDVKGGYFGVYLTGSGKGQTVSNSTFTDQYVNGIFGGEQEYVEIFHNKINPVRSTSFSYALNLTQVSNFKIHANTINAGGDYGIYLQLVNFIGADPNYPSMVYNNSVSNTAGYAFYCENGQEITLLHNSFRSVGISNAISATAYFSNDINIDFRNNHVRNDNPNSYALEADAGTFDSLDYNNYYSFGGSFVRVGSDYSNLADLKTGLPNFNQNSFSTDPQFMSLSNLHTNIFLPGTYAGIDKDIDGESRCPSKVSIGSDDENQGFAKPVVSTNHTDFFTKYPVRFENNIGSLPGVNVDWYIDGNYYTDSISFGYIFNTAGTHTIKLKAQRCIHFDSTDFVITVDPGTPKTIIIGNSPDSVRVFTSYYDSGATAKNYFGTDITNKIVSGNNIDTSILGTYYIWYVVEDAWGNKDSALREVKVIDDVAPQLTLTGSDTISIEVFANINEPGSSATDNYYSTVNIVVDSSMVNKNVVGIYPMLYTATDGSQNVTTHTRWVKVVDTEKPVITLIQADTIIVKVNYPYFEAGAKVKDNYCSPTSIIWEVDTFPNTNVLGDYELTYTATDCQGNDAVPVKRIVRVIDDEAPLLNLNGLPVVQIQRAGTYTEAGVDIRDNYYDTALLRGLLVTTSDLDENVIGSYSICYQVTDPSGNISNKICRSVIVLNNTGVEETEFGAGIKLYPNPNSGSFKIELPSNAEGNIDIAIIDMTGRVVYTTNIFDGDRDVQLNLEDLAAGVYQVNLQQGNRNKLLRINIVK